MIIDARSGLRGVLVNADTSARIPFARWANLETGEYEALAATPDGRQVLQPAQVVRGRCRLRWIPAAPVYRPGRLIVPRDEPPKRAVRIPAVAGQFCEHKGCSRLAEWRTMDEEELQPAVMPDGTREERARAVAFHRYCSWHYQNPTFTSLRGVEREVVPSVRPS